MGLSKSTGDIAGCFHKIASCLLCVLSVKENPPAHHIRERLHGSVSSVHRCHAFGDTRRRDPADLTALGQGTAADCQGNEHDACHRSVQAVAP